MKSIRYVLPLLGVLATTTASTPARATMIAVDEVIFQSAVGLNSANLTGTVDLSLSGTTLTIVIANTSNNTGVNGAPNVLTGLGLQLFGLSVVNQGTVPNPVYGSATVAVGDIINPPNNPDPLVGDVSFEWGIGDASSGHFFTQTSFNPKPYNLAFGVIGADMDNKLNPTSPDFNPPMGTDGVDLGLVNSNIVGNNSALISGPVTIVVQLAEQNAGALADLAADIGEGNLTGKVGLLFGSPTGGPGVNEVPEPASVVLFGCGILGLAGRRCLRRKVA